MTIILRQSTSRVIRVGKFVDVTDGVTPETGITLGAADEAEAMKAGGGASVDISGATWAAVTGAPGYYDLTLTTSHTDTLGDLTIDIADASVCLPVQVRCTVIEEAAFDAVYGPGASPATAAGVSAVETDTQDIQSRLPAALVGGRIDANAGAVSGDATAADNLEALLDGTGGVTLSGDVSGTVGGIAGTLNTLDDLDTAQDTQHTTTRSQASSNVASVLAATTLLKQLLQLIARADAGLATDVSSALATLNEDGGSGAGTFDNTTDSIEALRNRGDAAWTTGAGGTPPDLLQSTTIATLASQTSFTLTAGSADDDAYNGAVVVVTDQSTATQKAVGQVSDYVGSSKTVTLAADPGVFTMAVGDAIAIIAATGTGPTAAAIRAEIDANSTQLAAIVEDTDATLPAQISALNNLSTGDIDARLAAYDAPTKAELDAAFTEIKGATWSTTDTLEAIRDRGDAAWVTATGFSTHSAADVWAAATRTLTAATNLSIPTAAAIADAVLDEATSGHTTAGTLGKAIVDILADSNELQTDLADGGRLDLLIDSIITAIAALPDAAAINAQVVDALATDTYAEPGSVPAATASLAVKIGWIAALSRNALTQTATTQSLRNDANSGNIATRSVSDDGTTYSQGEWS